MGTSQMLDGAIAERPREIREHPLLAAVYARHDALIRQYLPRDGRSLELAFGRAPHPDADVGVEAFHENTFDAVIGRRFLHHVPAADRGRILAEVRRVLAPDGRFVLLEGTPGLYRRFTKGLAFRLGVLGEDSDEYGHLSADDVRGLLDEEGFETFETKRLGSPLMPLSIAKGEWSTQLMGLYDRTNWVRWWTFAVATPDGGSSPDVPGTHRSSDGRRPDSDTSK